MNRLNRSHTPVGIYLMAGFYLFGAITLLVSLFTNPSAVSRAIADAHALPSYMDPLVLPVLAGFSILIAYGLYSRARWGYFLTTTYLILFGAVSFWLMGQKMQQPYIGNATWSVLALLYLVWKRKIFLS